MGVRQFIGSIRRIARNPYIDRVAAVRRHLDWQRRRVFNEFPTELPFSESVLIASHGRCGVSALVNAHGLYDYNNMMLLKRVLSRGGVFVDVGANVGVYSLVASEQPAAQVLAFEPHPATFALLQDNLVRNRRHNVDAVWAAVGDREGMVSISDTPGSSTTRLTDAGPRSLETRLLRLDLELARRGLHADAIKIDVEGFEFEVLLGMGRRLAEVTLACVEINGLSDLRGAGQHRIVELLRDAGLDGPYYYDARTARCRDRPVHAGEDPIFVNRGRVERGESKLDCSALGLDHRESHLPARAQPMSTMRAADRPAAR